VAERRHLRSFRPVLWSNRDSTWHHCRWSSPVTCRTYTRSSWTGKLVNRTHTHTHTQRTSADVEKNTIVN